MYALVFEEFGGPEVLDYRSLPDPPVPAGHLQIATQAIGLNFADIYRRRGNYRLAGKPPYIGGYEAAGKVVAVGENVSDVVVGDRVAFADVPFANATRVTVPWDHAILLPQDIGFTEAAAILLQGLTAQYLTEDSYTVKPDDIILVHAAAGGVGQILTRLAVARGAKVIAMASTDVKREIALGCGAAYALGYERDWVQAVKQLSGGGVHAAYDSVGSTLHQSLSSVRTRGTVITYGMAGGNPEPLDPRCLMESSQTLVGGDLWNYLDSREARLQRSTRLFELIRQRIVRLPKIEIFALADGASAHRRLEDRSFAGKIVMVPQ